MVTTLLNRPAAREAGYEMTQYIAKRVQALASGATVVVSVGVVPAGAIIVNIHSKVVTAFTAGTLTVGSNATTYDNLVAAITETAAGSENLLPLTTIVQPLAVDTEFFASLVGAAVGDGYIAIQFIKPLA
jgi:hypothetical protein